jgi:predicted hotdog family 3-hydroxylacyl-ACP dehydratase
MSGGWPDVAKLVPHAGRMRLVSAVLEHTPERTVCRVDVEASRLFAGPDGSVPGWIALEWMAQAIAAHAGLVAHLAGARLRSPSARCAPAAPACLFLGARRARIHVDGFRPGQTVRVVSRHLRGERGLAWFECRVEDPESGAALAEGRLSVYALETPEPAGEGMDGA